MREQAATLEVMLAACCSAVSMIGADDADKAVAPAVKLADALKRAGKPKPADPTSGLQALMKWSRFNG